MSFFHDNQIFGAFCEMTLAAQKELFKVSFPKRGIGKWTVKCHFKDGDEATRDMDMEDKVFIKEWKEFARWWYLTRQADVQPNE